MCVLLITLKVDLQKRLKEHLILTVMMMNSANTPTNYYIDDNNIHNDEADLQDLPPDS